MGEVGSGKTMFLDALLGELDPSNGGINSSVAFVGQNPWIFSGTIRDNILFGNPMDEEWYRRCIECSGLHEDIETMVDTKDVGFNGTNLSGGQRQRIAFCRALYSKAQTYLLDDIFSSVDEQVAEEMFFKGVKGLLVNKTVILCLNQTKFLKYAPFVVNVAANNCTLNQQKQEETPKSTILVKQNKPKKESNSNEQQEQNKVFYQEDLAHEASKNLLSNFRFYLKSLGVRVLLFFFLATIAQNILKGLFELWILEYI